MPQVNALDTPNLPQNAQVIQQLVAQVAAQEDVIQQLVAQGLAQAQVLNDNVLIQNESTQELIRTTNQLSARLDYHVHKQQLAKLRDGLLSALPKYCEALIPLASGRYRPEHPITGGIHAAHELVHLAATAMDIADIAKHTVHHIVPLAGAILKAAEIINDHRLIHHAHELMDQLSHYQTTQREVLYRYVILRSVLALSTRLSDLACGEYEFRLDEDKKYVPNVIYVKAIGSDFRYKVLSHEGKLVTDKISKEKLHYPFNRLESIGDLRAYFPSILEITTQRGHTRKNMSLHWCMALLAESISCLATLQQSETIVELAERWSQSIINQFIQPGANMPSLLPSLPAFFDREQLNVAFQVQQLFTEPTYSPGAKPVLLPPAPGPYLHKLHEDVYEKVLKPYDWRASSNSVFLSFLGGYTPDQLERLQKYQRSFVDALLIIDAQLRPLKKDPFYALQLHLINTCFYANLNKMGKAMPWHKPALDLSMDAAYANRLICIEEPLQLIDDGRLTLANAMLHAWEEVERANARADAAESRAAEAKAETAKANARAAEANARTAEANAEIGEAKAEAAEAKAETAAVNARIQALEEQLAAVLAAAPTPTPTPTPAPAPAPRSPRVGFFPVEPTPRDASVDNAPSPPF